MQVSGPVQNLTASDRYKLKVKLACSVGKQTFQLIAELKGHEHIANAVTVSIKTCFCICFSRLWRSIMNDEDLKSDYLT